MLLASLFGEVLLAAEPDAMLGFTLGQTLVGLQLEKSPQGALLTTATIGGEQGNLFLVPCGPSIHEIIFQVMVFQATPGSTRVAEVPSMRLAPDVRKEARRLRTTVEGALGAAGWAVTARSGADGMETVSFGRAGVVRNLYLRCEPSDALVPGGPEDCTIALHAGGDTWCTAGL